MTNINQPKFKKARRVFDKVFNKYDFMNDLMSLGIHRLWKERLIDWMNPKKNDHLIDVEGGDVIEFVNEEIERLQDKVARKLGYELTGHRLELYGKKIKK